MICLLYTAIPRKVVGTKDIFREICKNGTTRQDVCLRVQSESDKSRFDSYSVKKSVLIISQIKFRDCRVHFLSDNLSRNSCIRTVKDVALL